MKSRLFRDKSALVFLRKHAPLSLLHIKKFAIMKSSVCLLKLALRHRIKNWYIHQQSFTLEYVSKRYSSKTLIKLIWILTRQVSKYLNIMKTIEHLGYYISEAKKVLSNQKAPPGSGGVPHFYLPPQFF